ncbi:hypothetical protein MMC13_003947 [Lambiella insularis]|nr:hypothetical protein [Lambiella insularis]
MRKQPAKRAPRSLKKSGVASKIGHEGNYASIPLANGSATFNHDQGLTLFPRSQIHENVEGVDDGGELVDVEVPLDVAVGEEPKDVGPRRSGRIAARNCSDLPTSLPTSVNTTKPVRRLRLSKSQPPDFPNLLPELSNLHFQPTHTTTSEVTTSLPAVTDCTSFTSSASTCSNISSDHSQLPSADLPTTTPAKMEFDSSANMLDAPADFNWDEFVFDSSLNEIDFDRIDGEVLGNTPSVNTPSAQYTTDMEFQQQDTTDMELGQQHTTVVAPQQQNTTYTEHLQQSTTDMELQQHNSTEMALQQPNTTYRDIQQQLQTVSNAKAELLKANEVLDMTVQHHVRQAVQHKAAHGRMIRTAHHVFGLLKQANQALNQLRAERAQWQVVQGNMQKTIDHVIIKHNQWKQVAETLLLQQCKEASQKGSRSVVDVLASFATQPPLPLVTQSPSKSGAATGPMFRHASNPPLPRVTQAPIEAGFTNGPMFDPASYATEPSLPLNTRAQVDAGLTNGPMLDIAAYATQPPLPLNTRAQVEAGPTNGSMFDHASYTHNPPMPLNARAQLEAGSTNGPMFDHAPYANNMPMPIVTQAQVEAGSTNGPMFDHATYANSPPVPVVARAPSYAAITTGPMIDLTGDDEAEVMPLPLATPMNRNSSSSSNFTTSDGNYGSSPMSRNSSSATDITTPQAPSSSPMACTPTVEWGAVFKKPLTWYTGMHPRDAWNNPHVAFAPKPEEYRTGKGMAMMAQKENAAKKREEAKQEKIMEKKALAAQKKQERAKKPDATEKIARAASRAKAKENAKKRMQQSKMRVTKHINDADDRAFYLTTATLKEINSKDGRERCEELAADNADFAKNIVDRRALLINCEQILANVNASADKRTQAAASDQHDDFAEAMKLGYAEMNAASDNEEDDGLLDAIAAEFDVMNAENIHEGTGHAKDAQLGGKGLLVGEGASVRVIEAPLESPDSQLLRGALETELGRMEAEAGGAPAAGAAGDDMRSLFEESSEESEEE